MTYETLTTETWCPVDPERKVALDAALLFHRDTATVDAKNVVATAADFLAFLQAGDEPAGER